MHRALVPHAWAPCIAPPQMRRDAGQVGVSWRRHRVTSAGNDTRARIKAGLNQAFRARLSSSRQLWADLALLTVTAVWGSSFVIVKEALLSLPPFTFIALRFMLATAVLTALLWRRVGRLSRRDIGNGLIVGTFLFAGFALQTLGLGLTRASTAGFITGLSVVLVPIVAYMWLGHRPGVGSAIGVLLATGGLGLLSLGDKLEFATGDLLVLGCAVAFALHIVAVGRFVPHVDGSGFTIVQLAFVGVVASVVGLTTERLEPAALSAPVIASVAFMGVGGTAFAFLVQNVAQRFTSPTHTALVFTMEPVFAAVFAYVLLSEQLSDRALIGGVLILAGMVLAEMRK
jgi:drug/metabolite transporter (DMT)-like permease